MKRILFLLIFLIFLLVLIVASVFGQFEKSRTKAVAEFELGADSWARRYFRPHIRFEFSLGEKTSFFVSFSHYQVMNKQLSGLVDFWIRAGLFRSISGSTGVELSINHMSRHITGHNTPQVFDVNDLIARAWYQKNNLRLGFGGGVFISDRWKDYGRDNMLLVSNLNYAHILNSEFSLNSEVKLINFSLFLWELELCAELSNNIELFVKNIKHYVGDPPYKPNPSFYAGVRFKSNTGALASDVEAGDVIAKVSLKPFFYLGSEKYRGHVEQEIYFEFMKKEKSSFSLALNLDILISKGKNLFFGTYRLKNMNYFPFTFEYEKKLKHNFYLGAYCGNKFTLPVDADEEAITTISLGLFARSQHHFEELGKSNLRYELLLGRNFQEDYELGAKIGANTNGKKLRLGIDFKLFTNSVRSQESVEFFLNISLVKQINIRPFVELKKVSESNNSTGFFSFGVCLLKF